MIFSSISIYYMCFKETQKRQITLQLFKIGFGLKE